ncbi:MAG TPA: hypothetical protein PLJ52_04335, partial [Tenuifilaceae bacterium]|nr:hypothetical protein [Tenuifilaceae bacterium]
PYPTYFLVLKQESKQRNSRLRLPHSKNYASMAKKSELAPPFGRRFEQQIFLTPSSLVFRLTSRGQRYSKIYYHKSSLN